MSLSVLTGLGLLLWMKTQTPCPDLSGPAPRLPLQRGHHPPFEKGQCGHPVENKASDACLPAVSMLNSDPKRHTG